MTPSKDMQVNVENHLTGICIHVEYSPVSRLMNSSVPGDTGRGIKHMAHDRLVFRPQIVQGGDMGLRHHKNMSRSLRVDVFESIKAIVFVYFS